MLPIDVRPGPIDRPLITPGAAFESAIAWPGMRSEFSWLPPHERATVTDPNQVGVSFSAHRGVVHEQAGRTRQLNVQAGSVFVTGADGITWTRVRELTEALEIYPDLGLIRRLAEEAGARWTPFAPASGVADDFVLGIAATLKRAHLGTLALSDIDASTLAHELVAHLLSAYSGIALPKSPFVRRLGPVIVARVRSFVDAHLDEVITLDRLAGLTGVSRYHFARVFKATTGLSPRQFVTMLRIERAKSLLLQTGDSVRSVAYAVGFTNVRHFRRKFREQVGVQPSAIRR